MVIDELVSLHATVGLSILAESVMLGGPAKVHNDQQPLLVAQPSPKTSLVSLPRSGILPTAGLVIATLLLSSVGDRSRLLAALLAQLGSALAVGAESVLGGDALVGGAVLLQAVAINPRGREGESQRSPGAADEEAQ